VSGRIDNPVLKDVTSEKPKKPTKAIEKAMGIRIIKNATTIIIPSIPIVVELIFLPSEILLFQGQKTG
jgi:ribosomal protein S12